MKAANVQNGWKVWRYFLPGFVSQCLGEVRVSGGAGHREVFSEICAAGRPEGHQKTHGRRRATEMKERIFGCRGCGYSSHFLSRIIIRVHV